MNKKKGLLLFGTLSAVVAPVAAVVACGDKNMADGGYQDGIDQSQLIKDLLKKKAADADLVKTSLKEYKKIATKILYEQEVEKSKDLQISDFRYQQFDNQLKMADKRKEKADTKTKKDALDKNKDKQKIAEYQRTMDNIDKTISDIKDKNKKIDDKIKNLEKTNWKDAKSGVTFNYEYPLLWKPVKNIKEEQTKLFKDRKHNFLTNGDKKETAKSWPDELVKSYGGAKTDAEGIDYLVNREIKNKGEQRLRYKINSEYDLKHYIFTNIIDDKAFPFLKDAARTSKDDQKQVFISGEALTSFNAFKGKHSKKPSDDASWDKFNSDLKAIPQISEKVYFISNSAASRIDTGKDEISNLFSKTTKFGQKFINVQHALVPFIRKDGVDIPWEVKIDDLKRLFVYVKDGTTMFALDGFFSSKLFTDEKFTDAILQYTKGDQTAKKQGYLGLKSQIQYATEMVPGFAMGILEKTQHDGDISDINFKTELSDKIAKKINDLLTTKLGITKPATNDPQKQNEEIKKLFDYYKGNEKELIHEIGIVIKESFKTIIDNAKTAGKSEYIFKVNGATGNYLVFSKFGFHIIKINDVKGSLVTNIQKEYIKMADKQDQSLSKIEPVKVINRLYSKDDEYIKFVSEDATLKTKFDDAIKEYNKNLPSDHKPEDVLDHTKLLEVFKSLENADAHDKAEKALANKIEWIKKMNDNKLISTNSLDPDKIYTMIEEAAKTEAAKTGGTP